MPPRFKSRFWRRCRIYFRRFRIAVWLLILALVCAGLYVNQIGLPGFIKRPLLNQLRARGIDLQFSRLRLRWYRGIVAEEVRFGRADQPFGPKLSVKQVELHLDNEALKKLKIQVSGLVLRRGQLVWPVAATNQPPRELSMDDIQTELHLLPNDQWQLDHFQARFAGARMQLTGSLTNASAVRDWIRPSVPARPGRLQERLQQLADALEKIKFAVPPELRLTVHGDARDVQSFNGMMSLSAPGADTPWGTLTNGLFSFWVRPASTNELSHAELSLRADDAQTRWGTTKGLQLTAHLVSMENNTNLVRCDLELLANQVQTEWATATNTEFTAHWTHSLTNPIPLTGRGEFRSAKAQTRWGSAKDVQITAQLGRPNSDALPRADESWAWWAKIEPYFLDWRCHLIDLESPKLAAQEILCQGNWRSPDLTVTNLHVRLYDGQFDAHGAVNVASREATFSGSSAFDAQKISPLLTAKGQHWLSQYSWENPPQVKADGFVLLPAWTNRHPDWRGEVLPTLRLQGELQVGNGSFRDVPVTSAQSHLNYSNMCWHLPDLLVTRPEGQVQLEHRADDRTRDYYWRIQSAIDVKALRPLLETNAQRGLDYFQFTSPPQIDAEVWGRWHDRERTGVKGQITLSNFTFRGETATSLRTALRYTNRFIQFSNPQIERGDQRLTASSVSVDFNSKTIYLTNGLSTAEPMVVARAIGTKTAKALEPYQFLTPPTVRAEGVIPAENISTVDLHFDVDGGPFHWMKFNLSSITGEVHWVNQTLTLTNVQANCYDGRLMGSAGFEFQPHAGTDFHFDVTTRDTKLQLLMADLSTHTNQLEGNLSGRLIITHANSADWQSWQGQGRVRLRDGLIWEIPVFGVFSPILNGIWPGLGNSRASEGSARFFITNGVIRSDDLEMRSTALRMDYRGTVDFRGNVDARVEAELLRDVPGIGPVVSTVFWPVTKMFEYKVTGSLREPKTEPVYIVPKIVLLPFHPFKTLKELLPEDSTSTNSPPVTTP